jgi:tetratricopeptide (TPR) repeat protein
MRKLGIMFIFCAALQVNAYDLDQLEAIFKSTRLTELPQIAVNLSARGSILQSKGQYKEAIDLYTQSLQLRDKLGLSKTSGYATVLFLKTIAHHKTGESCVAMGNINQVIEIYNFLGKDSEAKMAEEEGLNVYKKSCQGDLLTQN